MKKEGRKKKGRRESGRRGWKERRKKLELKLILQGRIQFAYINSYNGGEEGV